MTEKSIIGQLAACIGIGLIGSALWSKIPFFPYDCICSATSADGLHWILDKGVRVDDAGTCWVRMLTGRFVTSCGAKAEESIWFCTKECALMMLGIR